MITNRKLRRLYRRAYGAYEAGYLSVSQNQAPRDLWLEVLAIETAITANSAWAGSGAYGR